MAPLGMKLCISQNTHTYSFLVEKVMEHKIDSCAKKNIKSHPPKARFSDDAVSLWRLVIKVALYKIHKQSSNLQLSNNK